MPLTLLVNGAEHTVEVPSEKKLLYVLREDLGLTGSKYGCGEGQCGACTVLVEGKPVRSCQASVGAAAGKKILTIEGLERNGRLHHVQEAFLKVEAFQCAYCTSGMIMSAVGLLQRIPRPTDQQILDSMEGNICRCGTNPRILEAVRIAAGAQSSV